MFPALVAHSSSEVGWGGGGDITVIWAKPSTSL